MAAADDERHDTDGAAGRVAPGLGNADLEREGHIDRATNPVKHNIDRVADKVKHLLRSDH
jgi:hypothetical protein